MDPKETLILLLLALARNERAEAQDYADALADWLSKDGFTPAVDEQLLIDFRKRLYAGSQVPPPQLGILIHEHKYGNDHYPFVFISTPGHEQPLIRPIAEAVLNADFEPDREETLNLELCALTDMQVISGKEYADTTGQAFQGFDDEEIIIGEANDDGEEENDEENDYKSPPRFIDEPDGN